MLNFQIIVDVTSKSVWIFLHCHCLLLTTFLNNLALNSLKDREKKNQSEGGESEADEIDDDKVRKVFSNYPVKVSGKRITFDSSV